MAGQPGATTSIEVLRSRMLHALRNPVPTYLVAEDMTMVIGADRAGRLIGVGLVESREEPGLVVVHAMPARPKFLRG